MYSRRRFWSLLAVTLAAPLLRARAAPAEQAPVKRAKGRPEIRFGERGELIVDGKRRFIRGGYRSGQVDGFTDALRSAADAGFDMVHDYHFDGFDIEQHGTTKYIADARAYLRKAGQHGLGVFLGLPRSAVTAADEATLTEIVSALAGEHALWMWYIYDEPNPARLSVENAGRVYRLLKHLDPDRPSIMLTNKPDTLPQYLPYCDVLWYNRYPIAATAPQKSSLAPIAESLGHARKTVPAGKPVWAVVQGQDNSGRPRLQKRVANLEKPTDRTHRPNEAELRAQAHVAIASGSMAVVYYWAPDTWYSMKTDTPGIWASLAKVLKELGSLEAVLLAGPAPQPLQVSTRDSRILSWTRMHEGSVYVGLVNTDINAPGEVKFLSPDAKGSFRQVAGAGTLKGDDRGATVRLGPAGVIVIAADARVPAGA